LAIFAEWLFYMTWEHRLYFRGCEPGAILILGSLLCAGGTRGRSRAVGYTFKNDWPNSGYGVLVIGGPVFDTPRREAARLENP
jgi:hypothetical protein